MGNTFESEKLRNVAGAFATGITVVTTEKEDGTVHGMTANSFLSVSLDPPLVAFSIRKEGSMMDYLAEGKSVGISILTEEQEAISNRFAGRDEPSIEDPFDKHPSGVSTIRNCMAWYTTEIQNMIPAGDHYIVLCEVKDLGRSENTKPLIYYSGYQSLAL